MAGDISIKQIKTHRRWGESYVDVNLYFLERKVSFITAEG